MKKIYIIFLLVLCGLLLSFDLRNYNKLQILAVQSPSKVIVDLNKNVQIDDDETVNIFGIKDFEYNNNIITNAQTLYINYLFSKWAKRNLNNKFADFSLKNNDYELKISGNDYSKSVLNQSFALPNIEENKQYFSKKNLSKKLEPIDKDNLVLINKANRKLHRLDCKYARLAHNFAIIPLNIAQANGFKPCNYCHSHRKNHSIQFDNLIPPPPFIKTSDIEVFFIDSSNTNKPDTSCSQLACRTLLKEINSAKDSIDIAIYGIEAQPKLLNAIVNAQNRNVKIRLITDVDANNGSYYKDNKVLISKIKDNITDKNSSPKYIMHNKFLIFDNKKVWTGSSNLTSTDFSNFNTNYNILTSSPRIVNTYINDFESLYSGAFHISKNTKVPQQLPIAAYFSPQDEIIKSKIIPLINSSTSYVYMPIFYLTHKELTSSLIEAKKRGVDVKIIIDATNAHAKYTVHKLLRASGIPVKTENKAGKLHSKLIVIDDKYSIIGSMNFTKSGEKYNDENVIIIENPEIAKYIKSTFIYLWKSIPDKYMTFDPYAESKTSIGSCSDGIDNDFDGKIDKEEEFCK